MLSVEDPHAIFNAFQKTTHGKLSSNPFQLHPQLSPPSPTLSSPSRHHQRTPSPTLTDNSNSHEFSDYNAMIEDGIHPPLTKRMNYRPPNIARRNGLRNPAAYLNNNDNSIASDSDSVIQQQSPQRTQKENVVIVQPSQSSSSSSSVARHSGNVKYKTSSGERLFTLEEVKIIVAGALKEQDVKMRAEYEKLFYQKLHEQQLAMTKCIDEIRGANSSECSYIN